jgi:hypothetical protein
MDIGLLASRCLRISKQWKQSQGSLHWKRQVFMESSWSNSQRSESSLFLLKSFLQTLKIQSGLSPLPLPWSIVVWIQRCSWKSRVSTVKRERERAESRAECWTFSWKRGLNPPFLCRTFPNSWTCLNASQHYKARCPRDSPTAGSRGCRLGTALAFPSWLWIFVFTFKPFRFRSFRWSASHRSWRHDVMTSWLMTKFVNLSISRAW